MSRRLRAGFTLVELLVVITIIAVLMGLLLPAVNNARESGRRTECLNNLKQLSVAARNYETRQKNLPGYANEIGKKGGPGTGRFGSWVVMLFPDLERNDLWTRWNDKTTVGTIQMPPTYLQVLNCPSDPPDSQDNTWLAYVANCGLPDSFRLPGNQGRIDNNVANGVFHDHFSLEVANRPEKQIRMSIDGIADGSSNTLMFSENIQADRYVKQQWLDGGAPIAYPDPQRVFDAERSTGFVWLLEFQDPTQRINGNKRLEPVVPSATIGLNQPQPYFYSRPSSEHGNGVNVAMCGGETQFLREDIDYVVYQQLMTPASKFSGNPNEPNMPHKAYLLNDADWK